LPRGQRAADKKIPDGLASFLERSGQLSKWRTALDEKMVISVIGDINTVCNFHFEQ
jgi:hypothetical protein